MFNNNFVEMINEVKGKIKSKKIGKKVKVADLLRRAKTINARIENKSVDLIQLYYELGLIVTTSKLSGNQFSKDSGISQSRISRATQVYSLVSKNGTIEKANEETKQQVKKIIGANNSKKKQSDSKKKSEKPATISQLKREAVKAMDALYIADKDIYNALLIELISKQPNKPQKAVTKTFQKRKGVLVVEAH